MRPNPDRIPQRVIHDDVPIGDIGDEPTSFVARVRLDINPLEWLVLSDILEEDIPDTVVVDAGRHGANGLADPVIGDDVADEDVAAALRIFHVLAARLDGDNIVVVKDRDVLYKTVGTPNVDTIGVERPDLWD